MGARERRSSREAMLGATTGDVPGSETYQPQSVQQAPGKRGANTRPQSFNTQKAMFNKKIDQAQPQLMPTALWFIAGSVVVIVTYLLNSALFA